MRDFLEILEICKPIIIFLLIIFCLWFGVYKYTVEVSEANIINAYVSGELVYTGKKAFIAITSGGMTTTLIVYKKLFPFNITGKVYSNNDIKITN